MSVPNWPLVNKKTGSLCAEHSHKTVLIGKSDQKNVEYLQCLRVSQHKVTQLLRVSHFKRAVLLCCGRLPEDGRSRTCLASHCC